MADAWTTRSSRRFKTNIQPLEGALQKSESFLKWFPVIRIQGVDYSRLAALLMKL